MVEKTLFDKEPLRWGDDVRVEGIGIYAIFLPDVSVAPDDWQADLRNESNLLYVGQTNSEKGLQGRLKTHFAGTDSKTSAFRRAIGAMLYKELELEPIYKPSASPSHYSFRQERKLSDWIQEHCAFSFSPMESRHIRAKEEQLIKEYTPPLNTDHNPWGVHPLLVNGARTECMKLAKNGLNTD